MSYLKSMMSRPRLRGCLMAMTALLGVQAELDAADWYLHAHQTTHWNDPLAWWSAPEGGVQASTLSSTDNFFSNGFLIRTPASTANATFNGATLTLHGADIGVKTSASNPVTIGNLVSYGGSIGNWNGYTQIVNVTNFANHGNTRLFTAGSTRGLNITIGTLKGDGDLTLNGEGTILLTINSAANYYGRMYAVGATNISFQNAFTSRGWLIVPGGTPITLNANVTFSGVKLNGIDLAPGTHNAADLGFGGTGTLTVKAPVAWYLQAGMAGAEDWTLPAKWWSAATGGTAAAAISGNDDYFTNGFALRTPANASNATFGGGTLVMNGGSVIVKNSTGTTVTAVQNFVSTGGTVSNGYGNVQKLDFLNFENTGTTHLNTGTNTRGLSVSATTLRGSGNLNFQGYNGGSLVLKVANANNYRGTITTNTTSAGTITFDAPFFSAGAFDVKAGNTVVVNKPVAFAGLTVGGVVKAAKTYTTQELGFQGSGTVKVNNRPAQMFGVNISGLEGSFMTIPSLQQILYYKSKGLTLLRIPFKWGRVQPVLGGDLDPTYLGYIDTIINHAAANGMKVILDMHNYGEYKTKDVFIGSTAVPYSAYYGVWQKLATHFNSLPNASAIYAYDIMNEPKGSIDWPTAAQHGVNGVRAGDTTRFIMIEGKGYSQALNWPGLNNGLLAVTDPQKKIIYSAHCYFSALNHDGYVTYDEETAYPNLGIDKVAPFVEWCKINKVHGHIGEYGVPKNDIRWNAVLNNFLQYLADNDISGTCWGGGFPLSYQLSIEPSTNPAADSPQMPVLELFNQ